MHRLIVWALIVGCRHASPVAVSETDTARSPAPHKPKRTVVTETTVQALDPIRFDGVSAVITVGSIPILDALAATFDGNPGIRLVEVQAFGGDGIGEWQQVIADHRAQAIVDELIKRGVAPARLRPSGIAQPPNGRSNTPVFVILERNP